LFAADCAEPAEREIADALAGHIGMPDTSVWPTSRRKPLRGLHAPASGVGLGLADTLPSSREVDLAPTQRAELTDSQPREREHGEDGATGTCRRSGVPTAPAALALGFTPA
jgi:hypothetical protein